MKFFKKIDSNHQHKLALEELKRGRTNNALTVLNRSLDNFEEHVPSLELRADINASLNKWDKALADLKKIQSLNSSFKDINLFVGNSYFFTRNFDLAIEYLTLHIQDKTHSFVAYLHRAYSYLAIGKKTEALNDIEKAISIVPRNFQLYIAKANILEELNEFDKALISFDKAIEIELEDTSTYFSLIQKVDFLQRNDKGKDAISILDQGINENPCNADLYFKRGEVHSTNGDTELALIDLNIALNFGIFEAKTKIKNIAKHQR
jgi:tetratricopeptide (TPR) repeat protein